MSCLMILIIKKPVLRRAFFIYENFIEDDGEILKNAVMPCAV
jgi:hypothetical protein